MFTESEYIPILLAILSAVVAWYLMGNASSSTNNDTDNNNDNNDDEEPEPTRGFALEDLKQYDGVTQSRILIALKGTVYDVTKGKDFYGPKGSYHIFAGRDASRGLAKMSLELDDVDNASLADLSLSELDALQGWCDRLAAKYAIAGHLIVPIEQRDYTLAELQDYNGTDETKPLLLVMRGVIYDVSKGWNFYGPNGGYSFLGGRDASRALAKMSLDPSMVENPVVVDDLTPEENQVLDDWIEKLSKKYRVVGQVKEV